MEEEEEEEEGGEDGEREEEKQREEEEKARRAKEDLNSLSDLDELLFCRSVNQVKVWNLTDIILQAWEKQQMMMQNWFWFGDYDLIIIYESRWWKPHVCFSGQLYSPSY